MAPPTIERSTHNHTRPNTSPTHYTISGVVSCTCGRHDSTAALNLSSTFSMIPRTIQFGKYHITISLPKTQPVSDIAWWKKAIFNQLALNIHGLLKLHSIDNVTSVIAHEVLIETFTA